jgi:hypothetical protein
MPPAAPIQRPAAPGVNPQAAHARAALIAAGRIATGDLPAVFPFTAAAIAANQSADGTVSFGGALPFVLQRIAATSTGAFSLKLSSSNLSLDLLRDYVDGIALFGPSTNLHDFILPFPVMLPGNADFRISVKDLSGATNRVHIALIGFVPKA